MAEFHIQVVEQDGFVEFIATGPSDVNMVVAHLDSFFVDRSDRCVLWNLVDCDMSTFTVLQFPKMVTASIRSFSRRQKGARTAILVGRLSDRFLLRAYAARSEAMNALPLKVFEDRAEALNWVRDA